MCETPSRRTHPIRRCGVVLSYLIRYGWTVAHVSILVALLGPIIGIFILTFPFVSSASFSLHALFQTLRRHWCRLLRQRLNFSTPSRVVVTSDVVGSGKHWSRSDCRANNPVAGKARNRSSLPIGHGVIVPDPDSCRVVTELKAVEVSQLQCSDKVIDVLVSGSRPSCLRLTSSFPQ